MVYVNSSDSNFSVEENGIELSDIFVLSVFINNANLGNISLHLVTA